jgi:hypothetical protein
LFKGMYSRCEAVRSSNYHVLSRILSIGHHFSDVLTVFLGVVEPLLKLFLAIMSSPTFLPSTLSTAKTTCLIMFSQSSSLIRTHFFNKVFHSYVLNVRDMMVHIQLIKSVTNLRYPLFLRMYILFCGLMGPISVIL